MIFFQFMRRLYSERNFPPLFIFRAILYNINRERQIFLLTINIMELRKKIPIFLILMFLFALPNIVSAACVCQCSGNRTQFVDDSSFCEAGCNSIGESYSGTCRPNDDATYSGSRPSLSNPIPGVDDPEILIGKVINAILGVVGSLALAMFVYGGLMWMLAAGNNERVQKGKAILSWATIGLVVIFSAYALVKFVLDAFSGRG